MTPVRSNDDRGARCCLALHVLRHRAEKADLELAPSGTVAESDQSRNRAQPAQWDKLVTQNAELVTHAASNFAFCVTDANHLLEAVCASR
jgi:hypothetical protein